MFPFFALAFRMREMGFYQALCQYEGEAATGRVLSAISRILSEAKAEAIMLRATRAFPDWDWCNSVETSPAQGIVGIPATVRCHVFEGSPINKGRELDSDNGGRNCNMAEQRAVGTVATDHNGRAMQ